MRATIRQVAEEAGVSHVTVSNVLRGVGRTSEETRVRVLETARALNYLPVKPPTAQNRHIETHTVTLVPEHQDIADHELDLFTYCGIVSGARHHGYDVLTMVGRDYEVGLERQEARYVDRRSDGFIFAIANKGRWEDALEIVARHEVPAVVCYRREVPAGLAWVDVDNENAMQSAVEHLTVCGHRRIAYLSGPPDNFDEKQRRQSWRKAMRERGLDVCDRVIVSGAGPGYIQNNDALAWVKELGVTSVVCFNDTLALALWDTLESQGLSVPDDVSLIGVDNRPEAQQRGLSSVAFSFFDVGRLAMDAWIELKNGSDAATCCKVAPTQFVPRASVRVLRP